MKVGTRFGFAATAMLLALAAWTACTGDDPDIVASGALGQACKPGNTCNTADLTCVGGYCQLIDKTGGTSSGATSGTPGTSSGGGTSGTPGTSSGGTSGTSGTSSGGTSGGPVDAGACNELAYASTVACGAASAAGGPTPCPSKDDVCCSLGGGTCHTKQACSTNVFWQCDISGSTQCSEFPNCCVKGEVADGSAGACSAHLVDASSSCDTTPKCTNGQLACNPELAAGAGCSPGYTCKKVRVDTVGGSSMVIGLCTQDP